MNLNLLWMSICSLVFVVVVVFEGAVVLVTGGTVEACIFTNNLQRPEKTAFCKLVDVEATTFWNEEENLSRRK